MIDTPGLIEGGCVNDQALDIIQRYFDIFRYWLPESSGTVSSRGWSVCAVSVNQGHQGWPLFTKLLLGPCWNLVFKIMVVDWLQVFVGKDCWCSFIRGSPRWVSSRQLGQTGYQGNCTELWASDMAPCNYRAHPCSALPSRWCWLRGICVKTLISTAASHSKRGWIQKEWQRCRAMLTFLVQVKDANHRIRWKSAERIWYLG